MYTCEFLYLQKRLTKTPLKASSGILKIKSNVKPKVGNKILSALV